MTDKRPVTQTNPAVAELQALRRDLVALRDEVSGLRKDVKEKDVTDQVARGASAAIFLWVLIAVALQVLIYILSSSR
jgi:hypothetical protein